MKRTSKRYIITTSALNCYSYRVLSDGVDFSQYNNNPILLWMHQRANGITKDQILPLGRVVEIRREGDAWTGQPEFDETDTFAMSVYNKYEAGVLSMLSLGALPLEISDEVKYMLPGQLNPTVVRCKVQDVSCVDIGGNDQALPVQLYDQSGHVIMLSRQPSTTQANSTPFNHTHKTLLAVQNAVAAGKFTEPEAAALLRTGNDETAVKAILSKVKSTKINSLNWDGKIHQSLMPLLNKSWSELENSFGGGISLLKEHVPEVYKAKFFEKNGRLPAEQNGRPL